MVAPLNSRGEPEPDAEDDPPPESSFAAGVRLRLDSVASTALTEAELDTPTEMGPLESARGGCESSFDVPFDDSSPPVRDAPRNSEEKSTVAHQPEIDQEAVPEMTDATGDGGSQPAKRTPLCWSTLVVVLIVSLNESICGSMLFPFVGFFVARLEGVSSVEEAGYKSGLLIAMFQLAQFCFCKRWGHFSDQHGRVIALRLGVVASTIVVIAFGCSSSLWMAMLVRFLHGAANGNVVVTKAIVADITDATNKAAGFAALSASWGIGSLIGPAIGGILYNPVNNTHLAFLHLDKQGLFAEFPALLPCLVVSGYSAFAFLVATFALKETNKSRTPIQCSPHCWRSRLCCRCRSARREALPTGDEFESDAAKAQPAPFGFTEAFQLPSTRNAILLYSGLAAVDIVYSETFPLWASSSKEHRGLAMSSETVGLIAVVNGVYSIFSNLCFPSVRRRLPNMYAHWRYAMAGMAVAYTVMPFLSYVRNGTLTMVELLALMLLRCVAASNAYGLVFIFVAESGPQWNVGAITGIAQAFTAIVRSVVPVFAAPLFSASVLHPVGPFFNHHTVFIICVLGLIGTAALSWIAEKDANKGNALPADEEAVLELDVASPGHPLPPIRDGMFEP